MRSPKVITTKLPGKPESCWTATAPKTAYPKLVGSRTADVVVVGAGMVGVTAAYLLSEAGLSVTVRRGLPDFRQVDPELSSLLGGLHPLLLADCWQPLQAGSQQSTPRA